MRTLILWTIGFIIIVAAITAILYFATQSFGQVADVLS
jgi:hypothetical protein